MKFDLDAIRHFRMPTCEEEIAAVEIGRLRKKIASLEAEIMAIRDAESRKARYGGKS